MRFFADPESVVFGLNEEAHVEVQVGRLAATGRNPVYVDVEDGVVKRPHVESGFLARFAQCDREGTIAPGERNRRRGGDVRVARRKAFLTRRIGGHDAGGGLGRALARRRGGNDA